MQLYEVWNVDRDKGTAYVVDDGSYEHARKSALRRNQAARRVGVDIIFAAFPVGKFDWDDIPERRTDATAQARDQEAL